MAEENSPDEDDVEAERLRMMQEEIGGTDEGGEDTGIEDMAAAMAAEGGEDAGMEEMTAALAAEGGDGGDGGDEEGSLDDMLEQEMLKAMQGDPGDSGGAGALTAFSGQAGGAVDAPEGIERLTDVDVNVTVELGGTTIAIKDIMGWTRDSIVELEPEESEPVDVLVNGKLFAKGEVVVVGDTFGVRIIELVDQPDEPSFDNLY